MQLKDKVAVVTGAGSGIGRAIALLFAKEGAKVVCVDVQAKNCQETAQDIPRAGGVAVAVPTDVSKVADVEHMVDAAVKAFGTINILVNNAGILTRSCKVGDVTEAEFDQSFGVNVKGQFLVAKMCLPVMIKAGGGVIVSTSSASAMVGQYNTGVYNATKAACVLLTRNIALDYAAQGIRANCVCPALVDDTVINKNVFAKRDADPAHWQSVLSQYPMGRIATPDEVAQGALYLASEQSSFVTGTTLVIDGGFTSL